MATKLEMIYSVKELLKDHTDDSLLSEDFILFQIKAYRSMFLRQLYSDRAKELDADATQTFCVDTKTVDPGTCGITTGCHILRSVEKIPSLLSIKGRSTLTRVGPPIIGIPAYEVVDAAGINACMNDPYSGTTAFLMDNYLYLVGKDPATKLIKCISVTGIFSNPDALAELGNCDSCGKEVKEPCYTDDANFPVPEHMVPMLIKATVEDYVRTEKLADRRDIDNNGVPE